MANPTWNDGNDNWTTAGDWSNGTAPTNSDDVTVAQGSPQITTNVGTVNSVIDSATIDLVAGSLATTMGMTVSGTLALDNTSFGQGGSRLNVGTTLSNSGTLNVGNSGLSASTIITTAKLTNFVGATTGTINLTGNGTNIAEIDVIGGTAGFGADGSESGNVSLSGNSLIRFASGKISTIRGTLDLNGTSAFVADVGSETSNSALTGLSSVIGTLNIENGASIAAGQAVTNSGTIRLDGTAFGQGGSSLNVTGTLTNPGTVTVGNTGLTAPTTLTVTGLTNFLNTTTGTISVAGNATKLAEINVTGGTAGFGIAGVEVGNVFLQNDALIQFASGSINEIRGTLDINGPKAFVADAATPNSNSALGGLSSVTGTFNIENGVTLAAGQALSNSGTINVDSTTFGQGGSTLGVMGTLTNSGSLNIGNTGLSGPTTVSATGLANFSNTTAGQIHLAGGPVNQDTGTGNAAELLVTSGQAGFGTTGVLSGTVTLTGDSLIQFASGQIGSITSGSNLEINGGAAFIADASDPTTNSALEGLSSNAGRLAIENGVKISTTQGLSNSGNLSVDSTSFGQGGSSLAIMGTLTNTNQLSIGNTGLSASTTVSTTGLANFVGATTGSISVAGGTINPQTQTGNLAALDVGGAAGFGTMGSLIGSVSLTGDALIQFDTGQINTVAANGSLEINGANAFIADAATPTRNSALAGLSVNAGTINLENGAAISTTQGLNNSGTLRVDSTGFGQGGGGLSVMGTLTNSNSISIGNGGLSAAVTVFATGLVNSGTIGLAGATNPTTAGVNLASLLVSGEATGGGTINAVGFTDVEFNGAVDNNVAFSGITNTLKLDTPAAGYTGNITGFGTGDVLDLGSEIVSIVSYDGTTLIVQTSGGQQQTFKLAGPMANGLEAISDNAGGTDIVVCFTTGTQIRTVRGEVAVEDLVVGDRVVTASRGLRPIRWIGARTLRPAEHRVPSDVWPVRILAGAYGVGLPTRDLMLSPGHPVLVGADEDGDGGHLVPIMCLVNGTSIARVPVPQVTYWHIELDAHDILLAEGLPAESYLDWGDRGFFTAGADHALANPDFVVPGLAARCRPVAIDGIVVESERRRLDSLFTTRLFAASAWPSTATAGALWM